MRSERAHWFRANRYGQVLGDFLMGHTAPVLQFDEDAFTISCGVSNENRPGTRARTVSVG